MTFNPFSYGALLLADAQCLSDGAAILFRRSYISPEVKTKAFAALRLINEAQELIWKELDAKQPKLEDAVGGVHHIDQSVLKIDPLDDRDRTELMKAIMLYAADKPQGGTLLGRWFDYLSGKGEKPT